MVPHRARPAPVVVHASAASGSVDRSRQLPAKPSRARPAPGIGKGEDDPARFAHPPTCAAGTPD